MSGNLGCNSYLSCAPIGGDTHRPERERRGSNRQSDRDGRHCGIPKVRRCGCRLGQLMDRVQATDMTAAPEMRRPWREHQGLHFRPQIQFHDTDRGSLRIKTRILVVGQQTCRCS
jgi:hypothetical protein